MGDLVREGKELRRTKEALQGQLDDLKRAEKEEKRELETRLEALSTNFRQKRDLLLKELESLPTSGFCEFCGREDSLVTHHWENPEGSVGYALVCESCNSKLTKNCPLVELCGGFPSRDIQGAYIREVVIPLWENTSYVPGSLEKMETMRWLSKNHPGELDSEGITLEPIRV